MKSIYILLPFIILFLASNARANDPGKQPKTDAMLFGHVKSGNKHIPFATIMLKGTTIGTAADATGHFKMSNLPVGNRTIVISAVGYKTLEKNVSFEKGKSVTLLINLEPDNIGLDQIVVSADRNSKNRRETPAIVNSISAKLFSRTQNVTLSEGLNFSPGLRMENNCQNCGFSQVRMNGLEGPYTQILINSRPVFSGLAGVYGLELIPANMIERVEILRGGGSSMYGSNAIAGTVNLITKDPVSNNFSVSSSYGSTGVGVEGSGNAAPDYNINLNGSFVTDDFKSGMNIFGFHRKRSPFDANGDGFSEMPSIENTTLGVRFYQRISKRGKLTIDYFNINEFRRGGNKFELPFHESDITESVRHNINSAAATISFLLREEDKLSAYFSAQGVNRDSYYGAKQDLSAYGKTKDFTYSAGFQYIRQVKNLLFAPATFTSGLEINGSNLEDSKLGYYDPNSGNHFGNTLIANQNATTEAAFIQSEWKLESLILTIGARYDHYLVTDKAQENDNVDGDVVSPRVNLLYNLSHNVQLRMGYARGFRAPQIFDEDLHIETSGARQVLHKNAGNLKQETSNSYTLSFDFTNNAGNWQYQFLVEGFYTQLLNPFANEYGDPDENGVVYYTRINAEKGAKVKGVNLEFNASPSGNLQFQTGFTFQRSKFEEEQEFHEKEFFRSPGEYGYISLGYSPPHLFNIALTGNYTGPMLVPYFGSKLVNPAEGDLVKTKAFFDTGVKLSYDVRLTSQMTMELNGGVKNIFNAYQDDFDTGINRDPAYIYGPVSPRTIYFGVKFGSFL
ncbi:TonB-dependent receptor; Outer membrane receptor for ferrienterochelin and colicins [hydrothermal vent metagenome]|uniref:TonB-dependent receptor Outer membrane receptor for ferrienterochelin and colicins n=1 Tax=hydrothermal vent metagenome TaxID=652676 RepID=A0A3B0TZ11_9ZZZZ